MCVHDGREKYLAKAFTYNERHHQDDCKVCDGIKYGVPYLYAYDMNIRRLDDFFRYAVDNKRKVIISVYPSAEECVPGNENVEIRYIKEGFLYQALDLKPELYPHD